MLPKRHVDSTTIAFRARKLTIGYLLLHETSEELRVVR